MKIETVTCFAERRMPRDCCAVLVDGELVYAGRIRGAREHLVSGAAVFLHPDDLAEMEASYGKWLN